jgi:hypothetical protein
VSIGALSVALGGRGKGVGEGRARGAGDRRCDQPWKRMGALEVEDCGG